MQTFSEFDIIRAFVVGFMYALLVVGVIAWEHDRDKKRKKSEAVQEATEGEE